jgi:hypothetical protein
MKDTLIPDKTLAFLIESTKSHINSQLTYVHSNVIDTLVLLDKLMQISRDVMHLNELDSAFVNEVITQVELLRPINTFEL